MRYSDQAAAANKKGLNWPARKIGMDGRRAEVLVECQSRGGTSFVPGEIVEILVAGTASLYITDPSDRKRSVHFRGSRMPLVRILTEEEG